MFPGRVVLEMALSQPGSPCGRGRGVTAEASPFSGGGHWGEAVESPSLEIFQTLLDVVLCSLLWVTLPGQGVGLGDPQRALPTLTIL